ncbi:C-type lectin domain family 4 member E-like isoform X4 [Oncorhynchus masou masou]|uniref:C-type lectin domain family 4 member E-like isoform X4 n=1 Tax=Oncorhynchus masou masou TaxID=90313 RepID=UPI003184308A
MNKVTFDRGEMNERIVDIYVSADTLRDGETSTKREETADTAPNNGPGDQHSERTCCSDGWKKFECSCYFISSEEKTWEKSRQDCLERGTDLVIINSKEEQEFLFHFKKRVWIGLTDRETEETWKWVDGTPLTTEYWYDPQPDNAGSTGEEDCVEIHKDQSPLTAWNDLSCDCKLNWICEKVA